ncbi:MAG: hypothetical protein WBE31_18505, partial [Candidatus Sulfotelmatobacter sp.]
GDPLFKEAGGRVGRVAEDRLTDRSGCEVSHQSRSVEQVSPQTMPRILEAFEHVARHISMGMGYRVPQRGASGA